MDSAVEKGHLDGERARALQKCALINMALVAFPSSWITSRRRLMDFLPPRWRRRPTRFSSTLWGRVKGGKKVVLWSRIFVLCWIEVGNTWPSTALESHYRRGGQLFLLGGVGGGGFDCRHKSAAHMTPHEGKWSLTRGIWVWEPLVSPAC